MNGTHRRLSAERNIEADSLCRPKRYHRNPEEVESQSPLEICGAP
jgi:hypothetical protein